MSSLPTELDAAASESMATTTELLRSEIEASDVGLVDFLRTSGPQGVTEIAAAMKVTATAVRQRLVRLQALGDVERATHRSGRGRPTHLYSLTQQGRRRAGSNFTDLAMVLWEELRTIENAEVRRGLLSRLSKRMAGMYQQELGGQFDPDQPLADRMESVAELFKKRKVPFEVRLKTVASLNGEEVFGEVQLPMLEAQACPYPDLAEHDRGICSLEKMVFSELLGSSVKLATCRLDGDNCCTFQPSQSPLPESPAT